MPKTVLIIGAGPAGLTAGYELSKKGFQVTVLERDNIVGGISRTINYKGFRFDIGGHRFFTKNKEIEAWWENILHEDFLTRPRLSRWYYRKKFFDYPIKPFELLGVFGLVDSMKIALSYAKAKIKPITPEISVADWCINNFGHYLAKPFFIDYNLKLWGVHPKYLSKDFTSQRVKGISFMSALKDALKKSLGFKDNNIKSLIEQFKYPKYGPGMMWEQVVGLIEAKKGKVLKGWLVVKVKHKNGKIVSVTAQNGKRNKKFKADYVLSTMPLKELIFALEPKPSQEILDAAKFLSFRDFITVALMIDQPKTVPDTWVYTHDEGMKPIRAQIFKNWSPFMVPDASKSCIGFEYACNQGDELWSMSKEQLIEQAKQDLKRLGFASMEKVFDAEVVRLKEVYPVYLVGYKEKINTIKAYLQKNFKDNSLQPIGRGGLHRYNNSDHSMMTALLAVKNILGEGKYDQWQVNTDAEYHEESKQK
jgi:protoporphyrinogen oxidase